MAQYKMPVVTITHVEGTEVVNTVYSVTDDQLTWVFSMLNRFQLRNDEDDSDSKQNRQASSNQGAGDS